MAGMFDALDVPLNQRRMHLEKMGMMADLSNHLLVEPKKNSGDAGG
jgi:hypothetical protein